MNKVMMAVLLGLGFSASVIAQQAPNMIGTWVGETNDAVIGAGKHYPNGKANEIRFVKEAVSYKFDKQSNRKYCKNMGNKIYEIEKTSISKNIEKKMYNSLCILL